MEVELTILKSLFEGIDELAAKDFAQHLLGKKSSYRGVANPAGVIGRKAAGGNDTMDMRVKFELLTPGMQHTEESNFSAEA